MKEIKRFFIDVIKTFLYFSLSGLVSLYYILHELFYTLKRFVVNIIYPSVIEMMADLGFISLILKQFYFESARNFCMFCSKYLLKYASYCNKESEKIVESSWISS